jgi:hypothetical protein
MKKFWGGYGRWWFRYSRIRVRWTRWKRAGRKMKKIIISIGGMETIMISGGPRLKRKY